MFDQATSMGDGVAEERNHHCGTNLLCRDRARDSKNRTDLGSRSPVQSTTDTPGTSASTPTSSSEDGQDKLLGVDPDYCRRILVRGRLLDYSCGSSWLNMFTVFITIIGKNKTHK